MLGALAGLGAAAGVLLVIAGSRLAPVRARPVKPWTPPAALTLSRRERLAGAVGLVIGLALALFGGWFAAVLLAPLIAVGVPRLLSTPPGVNPERLEALEEWVRILSGVLGASIPLTSAIVASLPSTPQPIHHEVETLVARLQARRSLQTSLYAFADDLGDQTGDFIASALIGASSSGGAGLRRTLEAIAAEVADEVRMRRDIETARQESLSQARWLTLISVGGVTGYVLFTSLGDAYQGPAGQLVLLVLAAAFAGCLVWIRRAATTTPPGRFLSIPSQFTAGTR